MMKVSSPFFCDLDLGYSPDRLSKDYKPGISESPNSIRPSQSMFGTDFDNYTVVSMRSFSMEDMSEYSEAGSPLCNDHPIRDHDFTIECKLGEGSYGKVYKGYEHKTKKEFALKVIDLEEDEIASSVMEASCLQRIKSPYVVPFYNSWIEGPKGLRNKISLNIQMGLVNGSSLASYISSRKSMEIKGSGLILDQLVKALNDIHSSGVVHRDFTPSNIILTPEKQIVIIDFGISSICDEPEENDFLPRAESAPAQQSLMYQLKDASNSMTVQEVGTPLYASPQQLRGKTSTPFDDIYSLGIIMFELFSIFKTSMEKARSIHELKTKGVLPANFSKLFPVLADFIRHMTMYESYQRPSAKDILESSEYQRMIASFVKLRD